MTQRFRFSEAKVKNLHPPVNGKRDTYYDTDQPGLQLRVTSSGVKTFSILRRVRGGQPIRLTIGRWPDIPVELARGKAAEVVGKLAFAENPAEARRKLKKELRLGELFECYIADREKAGRRSTQAMRAQWELYLGTLPEAPRKPHGRLRTKPKEAADWSNLRLSELTKEQVKALHSRFHEAGKGVTGNRIVELLRAMYRFAIREEYIDASPAESVTPVAESDRSRFLKVNELPAFLEALEQEVQPWNDYFKILLYVGYRKSAVAAMKWEEIDLGSGTWSVPGERAKNGDPIVLPISGPALEILKRRFAEQCNGAIWVFPGAGRAGHITQPKFAWARILKRANISELHIHDLRRTLGSWMANAGVPLQQIGRVLGHKDPRSTQVYAHLVVATATTAVSKAHEQMKLAVASANQQRESTLKEGIQSPEGIQRPNDEERGS